LGAVDNWQSLDDMRHLCVAGPCQARLDDDGILHVDRMLALSDGVATATPVEGNYAYRLDVGPGELAHVCAKNGAAVQLSGARWLAAALRLEVEDGGSVVFDVARVFERFDVVMSGCGSMVTAKDRAFVRAMRAVLRNGARISDVYVAESASVESDDGRNAYARLHLHNDTQCDGNGVRVMDVAMFNRRVATWLAAAAS